MPFGGSVILCRKRRSYPDKFGFVAALPFPSSEGSIAEISYAMDKLGALGVKVPSNAGGIYLGDARWEAIWLAKVYCQNSQESIFS